MNNKYFILFVCLIIFIIIISITIVVFSKQRNVNENEKIDQEIQYIESNLIEMLNSLNNISFSNTVLLDQNTISSKKENKSESSNNNTSSDSSKQNLIASQDENNSNKDSSQDSDESGYIKYSIENNNILIQNEEEIDWNYLKNIVQTFYPSWSTIMIDLNTIGVKNEPILSFSKELDNLIISIENENKRETLNSLAVLYSNLPLYIEQNNSGNIKKINISYTKASLVNAYVLLEDNKWDDIKVEVNKALEYFNTIINSVEINDYEQNRISKVYVAINELASSINLKDKKLFLIKYINLMECAMKIKF